MYEYKCNQGEPCIFELSSIKLLASHAVQQDHLSRTGLQNHFFVKTGRGSDS